MQFETHPPLSFVFDDTQPLGQFCLLRPLTNPTNLQ